MKVYLIGAASCRLCKLWIEEANWRWRGRVRSWCSILHIWKRLCRWRFKVDCSASEAINLIKLSKAICAKAGGHLHKITRNSKEVLQAIPVEGRSKNTWASLEEESFQFFLQSAEVSSALLTKIHTTRICTYWEACGKPVFFCFTSLSSYNLKVVQES